MPGKWISKNSFQKSTGVKKAALDRAVSELKIHPNFTDYAGQHLQYYFDQATVDRIIKHMKASATAPADLALDLASDPRSTNRPRGIPVGEGGGPAPASAPGDESPTAELDQAEREKAYQEYGAPITSTVYRYYKRTKDGRFRPVGEVAKALGVLELEDVYGIGVYKIERREHGSVVETFAGQDGRGIIVGDLDEIEQAEEEDEEEEEEGQEGMFPDVPEGGARESSADLLETFSKVQKNAIDLMGGNKGQEDVFAKVLTIMEQSRTNEAARHKETLTEMDNRHAAEIKRIEVQAKADREAAAARAREDREAREAFITALDSNSKELQAAITESNERVQAAHTKLFETMEGTLKDQRNNLKDERSRVMDDLEDLHRRMKQFGPGSPIYGLIQHGLSEAKQVANQIMLYKAGSPLPPIGGGGMLQPPPEGAEGGGAPAAPAMDPGAALGAGIFDTMRAAKPFQDFMALISWAIEGDGDPTNLADMVLTQSFQDRTGQMSAVINVLILADVERFIRSVNPPRELREALRTEKGTQWWDGFRTRIKDSLDFIRAQAEGRAPMEPPPGPGPETEAPPESPQDAGAGPGPAPPAGEVEKGPEESREASTGAPEGAEAPGTMEAEVVSGGGGSE